LLRSNAVELSEKAEQNRATVPSDASNALPVTILGPWHIASAFAYEVCMQEPTYHHCLVGPCSWDADHNPLPLQTYKTRLKVLPITYFEPQAAKQNASKRPSEINDAFVAVQHGSNVTAGTVYDAARSATPWSYEN
jgi:hypothetical protein